MSEMSSVMHGLTVGAIPTFTMILATIALTNVEVSSKVEAALQNFAAGLIIAAVAGELFPIMLDSGDKPSFVGISVGFFVGLSAIYGIEAFVGYLEGLDEEEKDSDHGSLKIKSFPKRYDELASSPNGTPFHALEMTKMPVRDIEQPSRGRSNSMSYYEDAAIERASHVLANQPAHRGHLTEHLQELLEAIALMESKSDRLTNEDLTVRQTEDIAEAIDEQVHMLQYKLDHCRRLLEGSEASENSNLNSNGTLNPLVKETSSWVTTERKEHIRKGLHSLRYTVEHLLEHIAPDQQIDKDVLHEMRVHMDDMDGQISLFHAQIEQSASKWKRSHQLVATHEGDKLPMGLVLPVIMDCFVDGFLMGISTSISLQAGYILGFANSLEMAFLGMAYAARLVKCTGSSYKARVAALYGPPLLMFVSAGIGASIGDATRQYTALFIGMVAFGAVALLFLVCNELLIEAREAQGEDERWWISIMVFVGIYLVLMMDHVLS